MVMFGYIQPTNKLIAYAQTEVPMQELYAEVATIKPAHLVMRGTTDSDILLATMETKPPLGIAGYEQSSLDARLIRRSVLQLLILHTQMVRKCPFFLERTLCFHSGWQLTLPL